MYFARVHILKVIRVTCSGAGAPIVGLVGASVWVWDIFLTASCSLLWLQALGQLSCLHCLDLRPGLPSSQTCLGCPGFFLQHFSLRESGSVIVCSLQTSRHVLAGP